MRTLLVITALLLTGCSMLVPSEKRVSQSVQATEAIHSDVERTTERTMTVVPEMAMAVRPDSNVVAIPLGSSVSEVTRTTTRATTGAGSRDTAAGSSTVSIPLGVKIAILAFALGLLWLVIWLWRRTSPAVDAALSAGDRAIANAISQVENALATTTDAGELAKLNAQRALLEKERGKLKGTKP